jgi:hypothetical protein
VFQASKAAGVHGGDFEVVSEVRSSRASASQSGTGSTLHCARDGAGDAAEAFEIPASSTASGASADTIRCSASA